MYRKSIQKDEPYNKYEAKEKKWREMLEIPLQTHEPKD
jgi:hypothetical protein